MLALILAALGQQQTQQKGMNCPPSLKCGCYSNNLYVCMLKFQANVKGMVSGSDPSGPIDISLTNSLGSNDEMAERWGSTVLLFNHTAYCSLYAKTYFTHTCNYVMTVGKFVAIHGTVIRVSNVKPLVKKMAFSCNLCNETQVSI